VSFLLYFLSRNFVTLVAQLSSRINVFDPEWVPVRSVLDGVAKDVFSLGYSVSVTVIFH